MLIGINCPMCERNSRHLMQASCDDSHLRIHRGIFVKCASRPESLTHKDGRFHSLPVLLTCILLSETP